MKVEGIVLTKKSIATLSELQECDNSVLKMHIHTLTDIAKYMAIESQFDNNDKDKETLSTISYLFSLCDLMQSLFAEQEGGDNEA